MAKRDRTRKQRLRQAVARYRTPLLHYAAQQLRDPERAHDVVQECFLRLWRSHDLEAEEHVRRWLYVVCRNLCQDERRAMRRGAEAMRGLAREPQAEPTDPGQRAERRESAAAFERAWEALPPHQREVVRLKLQSNLTYSDIADITKLSVSNVGYLLHHALKALQHAVEAEGRLPLRRVK